MWVRNRTRPGTELYLSFPPLPALLFATLFARSLTLVPRSLRLKRTETLATQATSSGHTMEFHPGNNQSRSQHSTWECNMWLEKDQHHILQFNFAVLDAIVKTLDFNFISESSTLKFVHQHSSSLINIALDQSRYMRFSRKMNFDDQVGCWVTKGVPIPPLIRSWGFNFRVASWTSNVTYQHATLAIKTIKLVPFLAKPLTF